MDRRKVITSLSAFFGLGGSVAGATQSQPVISKNSTRCEISEFVKGAGGAKRGPNTAATQIPASRPELPQ
jgi:hypothetical protein